MKNKTKIPLAVALLCIGQYLNQGISSLPDQCIYYLTRESWKLDAGTIGFISMICGIAWYTKLFWGIIADKVNNTKLCLTVAYSLMLVLYGFICVFGLNLVSLIATGLLINICIAFADTNVDKSMVVAEQRYKLQGRLQCFDNKTEVLTNNGWRSHCTIKDSDKVLSLNPRTGIAKYYKIASIFRYNYNGLLYNIKNSRLNFLFSPKHKIFYKHESSNKWKLESLSSVISRKYKGSHLQFKPNFKWQGRHRQVPISFRLRNRKDNKYYNLEIPFNLWLKFLGWYVSEGCLFTKRRDNQFSITQTKPHTRKMILDLVKEMKIPYWESDTEILFCCKEIYNHLEKHCYTAGGICKARTKKVPEYVKNLSSEQINLLLETFNLGDGWKRDSEVGYCTTSYQLSNDLQELILKTGKATSLRTDPHQRKSLLYIVHALFRKTNSLNFDKDIKEVHYRGILWDVCVYPHHNIFIRREGRCCWTGNSIQWTSLGVGGLVVALGGAWIAKIFPETFNYKIAYGIAGLVPLAMLIYLYTKYKEPKTEKSKVKILQGLKKLKNRRLLMGLLFIACLQFCPSFGTALMIQLREVLGVDKLFLGYLGALGTVLGIVGYIMYYKFAYKYPMKKLLYFMVIFSALTNLFYLYLPNQWIVMIYNVAFGAFGGISFMVFLKFFVDIIPSGSEALFYAIVTAVSNFAGSGGSWVGGMIYDAYGYNVNVIVSTVFTLLCLFIIPHLQIDGVDKDEPDMVYLNRK